MMMKPGAMLKRTTLLVGLGLMTLANSGCLLTATTGAGLMAGLLYDAFTLGGYFGTTPLIPVSPYYSELIEDAYVREERYDKVPVLDPVEGEHAPDFCQDPPSPDEVIRALPNETSGAWTTAASIRWSAPPACITATTSARSTTTR
jgi:hypothetical protein